MNNILARLLEKLYQLNIYFEKYHPHKTIVITQSIKLYTRLCTSLLFIISIKYN